MKFTQIPENTFQALQLNAGVILRNFNPATGELTKADIIGATSGGNEFKAEPSFTDYGEDIDNCPANMKELKRIDSIEVTMSGSFITIDGASAADIAGAADFNKTDGKLTPRSDLKDTDFKDIWWVGDYSDKNGDQNGGFIAIHLLNALSTGGFSMKADDKAKGTFDYEFTAHYSMEAPDTVPYEIYIKAGTDESAAAKE